MSDRRKKLKKKSKPEDKDAVYAKRRAEKKRKEERLKREEKRRKQKEELEKKRQLDAQKRAAAAAERAKKEAELKRQQEKEAAILAEKEAAEKRLEDLRLSADEFESRWAKRLEIAKLNKKTGVEISGKQEGNIKKVQAFLRKLDRIGHIETDTLVNGIFKFKLRRFQGEVANHLMEFQDIDSVWSRVQVLSACHRRFGKDFTRDFRKNLLQNAFDPDRLPDMSELNEKELERTKAEVLLKQKCNLALLLEMMKVKIGCKDGKAILDVVDYLTRPMNSKENKYGISFSRLELIILFLDRGGEEVLRIVPEFRMEEYDEIEREMPERIFGVVKEKYSEQMKESFVKYFNDQAETLGNLWKEYRKTVKKNEKFEFEKGELPEDRVKNQSELEELYRKFNCEMEVIGKYLNMQLPEQEEEESDEELVMTIDNVEMSAEDAAKQSFFDDEESRMFYESVMDLRNLLPAIIFEKGGAAKFRKLQEEDEAKQKDEDGEEDDDAEEEDIEDDDDLEDFDEENLEQYLDGWDEEDEVVEEVKSPTQLKVEAVFQKLLESYRRKEIDEVCLEYCIWRNPGTDMRLMKLIYSLRMKYSAKIPTLSRFVATFVKSGIDFNTFLNKKIEAQFYGIWKSKDPQSLMIRLRNAKFLAEFTKFKLFDLKSLFRILILLIKDFTPLAIRTLSCLLENCGRWLYRNPVSHVRLTKILERVNVRKQSVYLQPDLENYIENSIYFCCPPPGKAIEPPPPLPILFQFIQKLIYHDLNPKNVRQSLKRLRCLPWEDEATGTFISNTLLDMAGLRWHYIPDIACLVAGLKPYQPLVSLFIVDGILETIQQGMDHYKPESFQRDLTCLKFLGEMYRFRLVDAKIIFDTLNLLLSYKLEPPAAKNSKDAAKVKDLDSDSDSEDESDDIAENDFKFYFRVHAICTLLETCGVYFNRGVNLLHRDRFLLSFLRVLAYFHPLPTSINVAVDHLLSQTKRFTRPETFEDLEKRLAEVEEELKQHTNSADQYFVEPENLSGTDDEEIEEEVDPASEEEDKAAAEERQYQRENKRRQQEALDMDEEFAAMIKESLEDVRRVDNISGKMQDAQTVGFQIHQQRKEMGMENVEMTQRRDPDDDVVTFQFVSRATKGKTVRSRPMFIPRNSAIAETKVDENAIREKEMLKRAQMMNIRNQDMDEPEEDEFDWHEEHRQYRQHIMKTKKKRQFYAKPKKTDNKEEGAKEKPQWKRSKHGLQDLDNYAIT